MTNKQNCPSCGATLPGDLPAGLCAACLLAVGLPTEQPAEGAAAQRPTIRLSLPPLAEKPGDKIGRYKLLQQIGEGGCGVVYMAEQQEPVKRRVALKVIKPGMDTREVLGRFEAERQALALMDHANIAKVFDAGGTETGRPFFVMELVRGIPITRYCDENKLNTDQRLELFIQVCQAIQHAHQKGIIHRDIKPSNILVADHDGVPVPKIIDFGIAKATSGQTLTDKTVFTALEQFIGTPAYMSPEQANLSGLDIDTRSDIYSLGVLLYELLTGKTPFDAKRLFEAGFDEIRRIIREEEPPRPSTKLSTLEAGEQTAVAKYRLSEPPKLLRIVKGDLDWIVMKCLEKDRNRRYETANGLAMELTRFLNNEPVTARPPSNLYRFQKMVRRNKLAVSAATAVATSLLLGMGLATVMFLKEKEARSQAEIARRNETELRQQAEAAGETARTLAEVRRLNNQAMLMVQLSADGGPSALDQAEKLALEAKSLADKLGKKHPDQAGPLTTLAFIQMSRMKQEWRDKAQHEATRQMSINYGKKAENGLREALTMASGDDPDAIVANLQLFILLWSQDRTNEANAILEKEFPQFVKRTIQTSQRQDAELKERLVWIHCENNLRLIGSEFEMFSWEHQNKYPFQIALTNGGTLELCNRDEADIEKNPASHFTAMSKVFTSLLAKDLTCPADATRKPAVDFRRLSPTNISYLLFTDAECNPSNTNKVLIYCPIHGLAYFCGGTIKEAVLPAKPKSNNDK